MLRTVLVYLYGVTSRDKRVAVRICFIGYVSFPFLGYTRVGLNTGAGVTIKLRERFYGSMQVLYSKNAGYAKLTVLPSEFLEKITLHYLEVPVTYSYRFNLKKGAKKVAFKQSIGLGVTYARLLKHKIMAIDGRDVSNEVRFQNENALLVNCNISSFISKSWAVDARLTFSNFSEVTWAARLIYHI